MCFSCTTFNLSRRHRAASVSFFYHKCYLGPLFQTSLPVCTLGTSATSTRRPVPSSYLAGRIRHLQLQVHIRGGPSTASTSSTSLAVIICWDIVVYHSCAWAFLECAAQLHRNMADDKPSVLIIGGLGYIGRFLALHIHNNKLASDVRLVDKVLPQLAWLAPEFSEACSQDKFMQADASRTGRSCPHPDRMPRNAPPLVQGQVS